MTAKLVANIEDIHHFLTPAEVEAAASRAIAAGATGPLKYLGAGGTGIVFRNADERKEWSQF